MCNFSGQGVTTIDHMNTENPLFSYGPDHTVVDFFFCALLNIGLADEDNVCVWLEQEPAHMKGFAELLFVFKNLYLYIELCYSNAVFSRA